MLCSSTLASCVRLRELALSSAAPAELFVSDEFRIVISLPLPMPSQASTIVQVQSFNHTSTESVWQMTLQPQEVMDAPQAQYPERPGEPDCSFYMRTGQCGFGVSCRYNHPPNRKLAAVVARGKGEYPERPGQPECQYYLKTGTCKFGSTCKYHHPKEKAGSTGRVQFSILGLPLRPGEKECAYYIRTGSCKYGITCKFHHPATPALVPISAPIYTGGPSMPAPQAFAGSLQPWPVPRPSYVPNRPSSYGPVIFPAHGIVPMPGWNTYQGPVGPVASPDGQQHPMGTGFVYTQPSDPVVGGVPGNYPPYMPGSSGMGLPSLQPQQSLGSHKEMIFPERPGQPECQYYMKTGDCKFGITCKFNHPKDRALPSPTCGLSPIGLPLRPGAQPCTFYTRYGICKFGPACKFDHPLGGGPGGLTYSPSASSLTDMPVAPFPLGGSGSTLAPSSSSEVGYDPASSSGAAGSSSNVSTSAPEGSGQSRERPSEAAQTNVASPQGAQALSLQSLSLGSGGSGKQVDILGSS